jgi:large subunit ribosomal protein L2
MGKPIPIQKRGKGKGRYTAPSHRFKTQAHYRQGNATGLVAYLDKDSSKTGVIMSVNWGDGKRTWMLAPEGAYKGEEVAQGPEVPVAIGNVLPLRSIPEGIPIFNIENCPGDGGKTVRSSGSGAFITARRNNEALVRLPSRCIKPFNGECRATIGVSAGGGRTEKPLVKAGASYYKMKARGHRWPMVRGVAMNPVAHPHGGCSHHAGKPTSISRNASPGQKVGHIASKRTGRKKRK